MCAPLAGHGCSAGSRSAGKQTLTRVNANTTAIGKVKLPVLGLLAQSCYFDSRINRLLHVLRFVLCSRDLDVLRAQRIIGFFTHKSTKSENPLTWLLEVQCKVKGGVSLLTAAD